MPSQRLRLTDTLLLRTLMQRAPEGELSARTLAELAKTSKSKISSLLNGGPYPTVDTDTADRIARAVGVHVGALFQPSTSTSVDVDIKEDTEMKPSERSLQMRLASHKSWAKTTDRSARTAAARIASHYTRFVKQAREMHPNFTDEQIEEVVESLRRAHYAALALRGVQIRQAKARAAKAARAKRLDKEMAELEAELEAADDETSA